MDRTERFRGRVLAGDRLLLDGVEGFLKTHQRNKGGIGEWTGHFEVPADMPEPLANGNRYRIVLIDGRSGTVDVRVSQSEDQSPAKVQFHGTGSFRK